MLTAVGPHQPLVMEVKEGIESLVDHQDDTPATPAITTIRPTAGDELLAPERHTPVTAVSRANCDPYGINEHQQSQHDLAAAAFTGPV